MTWRRAAQHGLVLPVALIAMLLLGVLAVALVTLASLEPAIARNLADGTRARLVAEAGLERARGLLVTTADWTALLGDGDDRVLFDAVALPGLGAREGTYTVRVRNDWRAGDTALTGLPPDAGGRTADTNQHVVAVATGRAGRARRTVLAVARRLALPVPPAAVALTGSNPGLVVSGDRVEIDGGDHAADGGAGACAPAWAIAVADPAAEAVVEEAVPATLAARLRGRAQDGARPAEGPNTVAPDAALDPAAAARFVDAVRGQADVVVDARHGAVAIADAGRGCGDDPPGEGCWGTAERPRVVHVWGPGSGEAAPVVEISGAGGGHGILVIEDGAARVTGDFRWHGLVIVTGRGAGLEFTGEGEQVVLGGVVIDQAPADGERGPGLVTGHARVLRSCEALDRAGRARRLVRLQGWHEVPLY